MKTYLEKVDILLITIHWYCYYINVYYARGLCND